MLGSPCLSLLLLKSLSLCRTHNKFDQLMKSKVVELILGRVDSEGVGYLLDAVQQLLTGAR